MESYNLQLKVVSCRHLKSFNFFQKLSIYAVISIKQKTPINRNGDKNPKWNHETKFDLKHISFLDCDNVFIEFDLHCNGIIFGYKSIEEVCVPFKHLVRSIYGKPNGVLNYSYKLNDKGKKYPESKNENGGFPVPSLRLTIHHLTSITSHRQFIICTRT
uniref:C2 domain-containing protein n=1 Tax=Nelumbo nucifera TaxID=4432 RepID=A0A822Z485_NELNU|nr:TPA_asm: hypothetical protein HUJ06_013773 [Nelumbo nucifera]